MDRPLPNIVEQAIFSSPLLAPILERWDEISLPDCWLVAGAVAHTYWNKVHEFPPTYGIKDVDIAYFDAAETSEEAETTQELRIRQLFNGLPVTFDVKNEARVHLWYEQKFGYPISAYTSSKSAIKTFPTTAGAIGLRPRITALEVYAPFGFRDLVGLTVRPNKTQITRAIYSEKVKRWRSIWPGLKIIDWDDEQESLSL